MEPDRWPPKTIDTCRHRQTQVQIVATTSRIHVNGPVYLFRVDAVPGGYAPSPSPTPSALNATCERQTCSGPTTGGFHATGNLFPTGTSLFKHPRQTSLWQHPYLVLIPISQPSAQRSAWPALGLPEPPRWSGKTRSKTAKGNRTVQTPTISGPMVFIFRMDGVGCPCPDSLWDKDGANYSE